MRWRLAEIIQYVSSRYTDSYDPPINSIRMMQHYKIPHCALR
jgi:hypothetical protein